MDRRDTEMKLQFLSMPEWKGLALPLQSPDKAIDLTDIEAFQKHLNLPANDPTKLLWKAQNSALPHQIRRSKAGDSTSPRLLYRRMGIGWQIIWPIAQPFLAIN
jgi:hypothetical protein